MKFAEGCIYLWSVSSLVAQQFQTRALPLIAVALVINTKPGAALVVMSMVPHHSNGLLNERSPRHGAIKDHILLLVDCRTYLISKTNSAKQSLKERFFEVFVTISSQHTTAARRCRLQEDGSALKLVFLVESLILTTEVQIRKLRRLGLYHLFTADSL